MIGVGAAAAVAAAGAASKPQKLLRPTGAEFGAAAFPQLQKIAGTAWPYYVLDFDAAASEAAHWYAQVPPGFTPVTANLEVYWLAQVAPRRSLRGALRAPGTSSASRSRRGTSRARRGGPGAT